MSGKREEEMKYSPERKIAMTLVVVLLVALFFETAWQEGIAVGVGTIFLLLFVNWMVLYKVPMSVRRRIATAWQEGKNGTAVVVAVVILSLTLLVFVLPLVTWMVVVVFLMILGLDLLPWERKA